jgi:anti-anti-sigma factor
VPDEELLGIATRDEDGAATVAFTGEVDVTNAAEFKQGLVGAVAAARTAVTVDLRGVDYLGSEGMRCLMHAQRLAAERGLQWGVASSEIVQRALETAGLDEWLAG